MKFVMVVTIVFSIVDYLLGNYDAACTYNSASLIIAAIYMKGKQ